LSPYFFLPEPVDIPVLNEAIFLVSQHIKCEGKTSKSAGLASAAQNIYLTASIPKVLKVAPLLAQYLYTYKRLDLPGLGTFLLDSSTVLEPESNKKIIPVNLEGVSFENMPSIKESPELIQFISSQTGKIKALASADLNSYLGQAQQFLNIGKPFLFEGIGSLTKIRSGEFSFTPGQAMAMSIKEVAANEIRPDLSAEKTNTDYKSVFYQRKAS